MTRGVHGVLMPFMRRFRSRRLRLIVNALDLKPSSRILDVGGSPWFWRDAPVRPRITFVNLYRKQPEGLLPGDEYLVGDGRALPFAARSFSIAISNSVIEHVGGWEDQQRFAAEVRRVANAYVVQTPNRFFLLEPHFVAPGIQFLPYRWRPFIVRYVTPVGWSLRRRPDYLRQLALEVRLLSPSEVRLLFPEARVLHERFFGFSKSLLAIRTG